MVEQNIILGDREYEFQKYGYKELRKIRNATMVLDLVTKETRLLMGDYQYLTIFYSLKKGLKNEKKEDVPTTEENFEKYFPKKFFDEAFVFAENLNSIKPAEKNV